MYTSYWASPKLREMEGKGEAYIVQISNSRPKGYGEVRVMEKMWDAVPEWRIVEKSKRDGDHDFYTREYLAALEGRRQEILKALTALHGRADGRKIVLCCYEKPANFCHRHLFADYCNQKFEGIRIEEL